ncbi:MAG TPA: MFS transporter, partial [Phormidium sp.]
MAKDKRQRTKNLQVFSTLKRTQRRNLLTLFATGLLFWTSLASLLPTLPLYVNRVGGTPQQIGIVMGAFAIGLLLFRPWLGRIADQKSRTIVLILGTAVAAIAPLGFLFVKSIPLLFLLRAFHGISIAAFTTAYSALVVDLSPINQRGELIGYMSLVQPLGVAIGPAVGGLIQSESGFAALFILAAVLGGASFLGAIQIKEPSKLEIQQNTPITSPESPATDTQFWRLLFSARLRIPALVLLLIGSAFGALSTFIPLYI